MAIENITSAYSGPLVTGVDFAVPTAYTLGDRFATFHQAVQVAQSRIKRLNYPGQTPDHRYTRQFVHMRQVEPIQDRGGSVESGSDGVIMSWEVFHDGTVRATE